MAGKQITNSSLNILKLPAYIKLYLIQLADTRGGSGQNIMEMKPRKTASILRSIERILKHNDMNHLTKDAYDFVNIMGGFIAHYDINGFIAHYSDVRDFVKDLQDSIPAEISMRDRDLNETPERGYSKPYNGYGLVYCQSAYNKAKGIKTLLEKYTDTVLNNTTLDDNRLALLSEITKRVQADPRGNADLLKALFTN